MAVTTGQAIEAMKVALSHLTHAREVMEGAPHPQFDLAYFSGTLQNIEVRLAKSIQSAENEFGHRTVRWPLDR